MASQVERVVITISIDTECDHDTQWARAKPLTFESINEGLPNRLQPVFIDVGAVPTYLLTVEVLEDDASVQTLKKLPGSYEYGTHLHASFIEPEKKYQDYAGVYCPAYQCESSEDVEFQKLQNLDNLFIDKLGTKPTSFRAGRYGASSRSLVSLETLGYLVDTSVTPGILWKGTDVNLDFRRAPMQPYLPSVNSLTEKAPWGSRNILEAPVTVMPRWGRRNPRWFRPWFSDVVAMKSVVNYHLKKFKNEKVINLNMMFHSMEVIAKASPYPQTQTDVDGYLQNLHETLAWCRTEGFEFAGLSDLHHIYAVQS